MTEISTDRLPTYSISAIVHLKERLSSALVPQFADITIGDAEDLALMARIVLAHMPPRVQPLAVTETLRPLLGSALSAPALRDLSWRLAAGLESLRAGRPVPPWFAPGIREWAPLQILRVRHTARRDGAAAYTLTMRALAGTACPIIFDKTVTGPWLSKFSRFVGFTRANKQRPYVAPEQFTSLRVFGLLDPALSRESKPGFHEVRCSSTLLAHNVDVLSWRYRLKHFKCPHDYQHECHQCYLGYMACKAATHRETYVRNLCMSCGEQAWFDPENAANMCIACVRRHDTRRN